MAIVNVKFQGTTIALESDNENRIQELAERLNKKADLIARNPHTITDTKLAIISALMLEDQLDLLAKSSDKALVDETKAAFIKTVTNLSEYIEQLADRIEKR